jgi:hypothetical protein
MFYRFIFYRKLNMFGRRKSYFGMSKQFALLSKNFKLWKWIETWVNMVRKSFQLETTGFFQNLNFFNASQVSLGFTFLNYLNQNLKRGSGVNGAHFKISVLINLFWITLKIVHVSGLFPVFRMKIKRIEKSWVKSELNFWEPLELKNGICQGWNQTKSCDLYIGSIET